MATPSIKTLSVPALLALRADIDQLLMSRKSELQEQLMQIDGGSEFKTRKARKGVRVGKKTGKVAPLYRHPTTGETWSGRGGTARWLAAEIKAGKKKEDFLIAGADKKKSAKKSAKKSDE